MTIDMNQFISISINKISREKLQSKIENSKLQERKRSLTWWLMQSILYLAGYILQSGKILTYASPPIHHLGKDRSGLCSRLHSRSWLDVHLCSLPLVNITPWQGRAVPQLLNLKFPSLSLNLQGRAFFQLLNPLFPLSLHLQGRAVFSNCWIQLFLPSYIFRAVAKSNVFSLPISSGQGSFSVAELIFAGQTQGFSFLRDKR